MLVVGSGAAWTWLRKESMSLKMSIGTSQTKKQREEGIKNVIYLNEH